MTRRNEVSRSSLNRGWPHQVELAASLVRGSLDEIHAFCHRRSSAATRSTWVRRFDRDWIRFPFSAIDDADAFQLRFGGRRLTVKLIKNRYVDDWGPLEAPTGGVVATHRHLTPLGRSSFPAQLKVAGK